MGVRYFCDRCGDVGANVGRFGLNPCVSTPHKTDALPKFDGEVCGVCLEQLCRLIKDALASKRF